MLTLQSKLREVRAHPIGSDIIDKLLLLMNLPSWLIDNPIAGGMSLNTLRILTGRVVSPGFFEAVLKVLNSEPEVPVDTPVQPAPAWWKEAVFYQIYPLSFVEGGLRGILSKLDYLHELGVDAVWLSPVYDSPGDDNGYDVRDYYTILPKFGSMDDMDALIAGLHERGMKLVMDLVLNHTSDEHMWYQSALKDKASPYRDFYFFREGTATPNNWTSFFGGSAWKRYDEQGVWALHLFSKKQMDLNWACPELRQELYKMARWWLSKGVDGFRLDVVNLISKPGEMPDGDPFIGALTGYIGAEHFFHGPRLHEYLEELRAEAFEPFEAFSVGETPGIGIKMSRMFTDVYRRQLDLVFLFDHLETPGHTRFDDYRYKATYLKRFYTKHLNADLGHGWNALFFNNHDNPRMISKIDPEGQYAEPLAKMLALLQLTLRGTPFLYQGDEAAARNQRFTSIDQIQDVESLGLYPELLKTMPPEDAFKRILAGTRDHARAPLDWAEIERQRGGADSVWRFYQELIALRRSSQAWIYGDLEFLYPKDKHLLCYRRRLIPSGDGFYVEANLTPKKCASHAPNGAQALLGNYEGVGKTRVLRPYEGCIYKVSQ
ncbi:MAG: alpha-glucosidase [Peptococcaceae bacterium]|nr:alpha-glucosidase [Peptococcaceae bacterium]